jgi:quercetin dioxygenase-like cupin family protein
VRVIENPVSGERIVIRQSGDQTGGRLLSFDLFLPPGAHVPAGHVHPVQEERFTVITGRLRFRIGGRTVLAGPAQTVVVPPGISHWFGNPGPEAAHALVEVRPALRTEEFFEATEAMGRAGRLIGRRLPRPSDLALLLTEFRREVAIPGVPALLARALLAPGAWLARRRRGRIR